MRKKLFIVILLTLFCTGIFTACNVKTSLNGQFSNGEFIMTVNEQINLEDKISIKGLDKSKIKLISSNEEILKSTGDYSFVALSQGKTYVFANYGDETLAKVQVVVRSQYSSPQNIVCQPETGLVTWDKSFAIVDGQTVYPEEYQVTYNDKTVQLNTNSVYLHEIDNGIEPGHVTITLKAVSTNKYVADSEVVEKQLSYGVMGEVYSIKYQATTNFTQNGNLTWDYYGDALFDVAIDGTQIAKDLDEKHLALDFTSYSDNKEYTITITAKDKNNIIKETATSIKFKTLAAPKLEYKFDDGGYLAWNQIEGATSYILGIKNVFEDNEEIRTFYDTNVVKTYLEGLKEGVYDVRLMACGQSDGNIGDIVVNSKTTDILKIGKLAKPQVTTSFNGETLTLTFNEDKYIKDYKLVWEDKNDPVDVSQNRTVTRNLRDLMGNYFGTSNGKHKLAIYSLPAIENGKVNEFTFQNSTNLNDAKTTYVISSDYFEYDFIKLEEMSEITHKYENDKSTLTFNSVSGASFYELYLNDQKIEGFEKTEENGKVTLTIENLKNQTPNGDTYLFRVEAGYKEGDIERAIRSQKEKKIKILPLVTEKSQQTNGKFEWNKLTDIKSKFKYDLIKLTDNGDQTITTANTIIEPVTTEKLEPGFYKIKITSISVDTNQYLDSDFHNKDNFKTFDFKVTTTLQTPKAKLIEGEDGTLTVEIEQVEHAGFYEVLVDNGQKLDGKPQFTTNEEKLTYKLEDKLETEGAHTIKIVAVAGNYNSLKDYSSEIYKDSLAFTINAVRLAKPVITRLEDVNKQDYSAGQEIEVSHQTGSKGAKFVLGGDTKEEKGFTLQMLDTTIYGTDFNLDITMLGQEINNIVYLNSASKQFTFKRVSAPADLKFNKGQITWTNGEHLNNIYFDVKLAKDGSDYHAKFTIGNAIATYNFQEYIENTLGDDAFRTAYLNADHVDVEIMALGEGEDGGIYYLNSLKSSNLKIDYLKQLTLTVEVGTKTISWNKQTDNTRFDVYIDGKIVEGLNDYTQNSLASSVLTGKGIDFVSKPIEITVMARDDGYLNSIMSNNVFIKEIVAPSKVDIVKSSDKYSATFKIEVDSSNISSVEVNNSSINSQYLEVGPGKSARNASFSGGSASFELTDLNNATHFSVIYKAKNEGKGNVYYFDSQAYTFDLKDLKDVTLGAELKDDKLTFHKVAEDAKGYNEDKIIYQLIIKYTSNGEQTYTHVLTADELQAEELLLADIEDLLPSSVKLNGKFTLSLCALVSDNYNLTGESALGYYGKTNDADFESYKLAKIEKFDISVADDNHSQSQLDNKVNSVLKVEFEDIWKTGYGDTNDLEFEVQIEGVQAPLTIKAGNNVTSLYTFTHENGKYTLTLEHQLLNFILPGDLEIHVVVERAKSISSEESSFTIEKFAPLSEEIVSISDEGIVTINDSQEDAKYLIEVCFGKEKECATIDSTKKDHFDLMSIEKFKQSFGAYTINLDVFDGSTKPDKIPSAKYSIEGGIKLEPIKETSFDEVGNIILKLEGGNYEGIHFIVRKVKDDSGNSHSEDVDVTNKVVSNNGNVDEFKISMIDTILAFEKTDKLTSQKLTYEFSIKKPGSVKAEYKQVEFNYNQEKNPAVIRRIATGDDDFIILDKDEDGKETQSIRVSVQGMKNYSTAEGIEREEFNVVIFFILKDDSMSGYCTFNGETKDLPEEYSQKTKGYWVKEKDNEYFTTIEPQDKESEECFGISLNTVLHEIDYGNVKIEVSRVVKDKNTQEVYQNGSTYLERYKLCQVGNFEVRNGILEIAWQQEDQEVKDDKSKDATMFVVVFDSAVSTNTGEEVVSNKIFTSKRSLNLNDYALDPGKSYSMTIIALSQETDVAASSETTNHYTTLKYTTPLKLEVKNGRITFNTEEFEKSDFFKDIKDFFESTDNEGDAAKYYLTLAKKTYTSPFYMTAASLAQATFNLTLTNVDTHKVYTISNVKGVDLLPDIKITPKRQGFASGDNGMSYFDLLKTYYEQIKDQQEDEIEATQSAFTAIINASRGIADNLAVLDYLTGGRSLPEGHYTISATHFAANAYINSDPTDAVHLYVTPPPEVTLKSESESGTNNTIYYAYIKEVKTLYKNGSTGGKEDYTSDFAKVYKMQITIQGNIRNIVAYLLIEKNDGEWKLTLSSDGGFTYDSDSGELDEIISSAEGGFKLNLSKLKDVINEKREGVDLIQFNETYNINIFAYNGLTKEGEEDKAYVSNGKCGTFELKYLNLNADDITFDNGKFYVKTEQKNEQDILELLLRYRKTSSNETSKIMPIKDNSLAVDFDDPGNYDYVIFSLCGSIKDHKLVNIESQSYYVANVYKPEAPHLETQNNKILIGFNNNDVNSFDEILKFNITNDKIGEYYYSGSLKKGETTHWYTVGVCEENGELKFTHEKEASSFTVYLTGNEGKFTQKLAEEGDFGENSEKKLATYVLQFTQNSGSVDHPVLSSAPSTLKAKMLSEADSVPTVDYGGILVKKENDIENLGEGLTLIYKVDIEYYTTNAYAENGYSAQKTDTFYLEKLPTDGEGWIKEEELLKGQLIDGRLLDEHYQYYRAFVTMIAAKETTETEGSKASFETLSGKKYDYSTSLCYSEEESGEIQILQSQVKQSQFFERTDAPVLITGNKGTRNGALNFALDKFDNTSNETLEKQIKIIATYQTKEGADKEIEVKGSFTFNDLTEQNQKYSVQFTPEEGQFNDVKDKINFKIYVWGKKSNANMIWSLPLEIKDVQKLLNPTEEYYDIELSQDEADNMVTVLNFKKYFDAIPQSEKQYYKIEIKYSVNGSENVETLQYSQDSKDYYITKIPENAKQIVIKVVDSQEDTMDEENRVLLINSDTITLTLATTTCDNMEITWKEDLQRFEWTFDQMSKGNYVYYVTLRYADNSTEEKTFTTNNYYMPRRIGNIAENGLTVRARLLSEKNDGINVFSAEQNITHASIDYKLFTSGDGSQGNPYIISDEKGFKNMALRNTSEFYFKLNNDITIKLSGLETADKPFIEKFYGHLDGNSKKVTLTLDKVYTTSQGVEIQLVNSTKVKFTQYSSLFYSVESGATITKLSFDVTISNSSLSGQNILYSPIALYNYGSLSEIKVTKTEITLKNKSNDSNQNNIFVGGIASVNYGSITHSSNNSELTVTLNSSQNINFGYAGIALENLKNNNYNGIIQDCYNKAKKEVKSSNTSAVIYLAGITLVNTSTLSRCGNDGELHLSSTESGSSQTTAAGYFAGIVLTSANGTLEYLYNNSSISNRSDSNNNFNFAGIAYDVTLGTINTLVETSASQPIIKVSTQNPTQISGTQCYAPSNSNTQGITNVSTLDSFPKEGIDCKDGYKMTIENSNNGNNAKISKNS